jgi:hypothetical protein
VKKIRMAAAILGYAIGSAVHAATVALPGAIFNDGLSAGSFDFPCTIQSCPLGGPLSVSQFYVDGKGSISIAGSNVSPFGTQLSFGVTLTYFVEVMGPQNVSVPVDFMASGSTITSSDFDDIATANASFNGASTPAICAGGGNCNGPLSASFAGPYHYSVTANTPIQVQLSAVGTVGVLAGGGATFSAAVDPSVVIDSSFTDAGYSVIFSPDLAPAPAPLPDADWLLLGGLGAFAGLGITRRR